MENPVEIVKHREAAARSVAAVNDEIRAQLERDKKAFIERGGKITHLDITEKTGYGGKVYEDLIRRNKRK